MMELTDFRTILMPGLHGSDAQHWQSRWQRLYPAFERVVQQDWDDPQLALWSQQLDLLRARDARPTLIVAHSFGCLATVHSVARDCRNVAALLLVAPADPDKFGVAALLPQAALGCPCLMIASSNDPWISAPRAAQWARRWGSSFIDAGALGHINAESGLEDWPDGLHRLQALAEQGLPSA
jgi:predicted alpha/beta hydrolase family esterase